MMHGQKTLSPSVLSTFHYQVKNVSKGATTNIVADIPSETAFALATQRKQKRDKQHEINMPNSMPT